MGICSSCCTNEESKKEVNMDIDTDKNKDNVYVNKVIMIQSILRSYLDQK